MNALVIVLPVLRLLTGGEQLDLRSPHFSDHECIGGDPRHDAARPREWLVAARVVEERVDHGLVGQLLRTPDELPAEAVGQNLVCLELVGALIDGHEARRRCLRVGAP